MKNVNSNRFWQLGLASVGLVTMCGLIPEISLAASGGDIGSMATNLTGQINSFKELLKSLSVVAGLGFGIGGLVKFKAHKDNPNQVPLSAPIVLLVVAAGLLALPSLLSMGATSLGMTAATL